MAQNKEEEDRKRAEDERKRREARESREREESKRLEEVGGLNYKTCFIILAVSKRQIKI